MELTVIWSSRLAQMTSEGSISKLTLQPLSDITWLCLPRHPTPVCGRETTYFVEHSRGKVANWAQQRSLETLAHSMMHLSSALPTFRLGIIAAGTGEGP